MTSLNLLKNKNISLLKKDGYLVYFFSKNKFTVKF